MDDHSTPESRPRSPAASRAFLYRQLAATILLWLSWSFAFTLGRALIDGILEGRLPRVFYLWIFFVMALLTGFVGAHTTRNWRLVLGIFSVVLPVLTLGLTFIRDGYPGGTETIAFVLASALSIVTGVLLLQAEHLRGQILERQKAPPPAS